MLTFVAAVFIMLFVLAGIAAFIAWAIRESLTARKYRYLIRLHKAMPAHVYKQVHGPQWNITYKMKGKMKTETIEAATEGEALKILTSRGVGPRDVISSVKL
jgi:hypothetical protein